MRMHDIRNDPAGPSDYECLACGAVVTDASRPDECPECDHPNAFRDRAMSLE
jgi:rubrerythrin